MKLLCETCKFCKALTKIEGSPSFLVCGKRMFSQNYPTIQKCADYQKDSEELPVVDYSIS